MIYAHQKNFGDEWHMKEWVIRIKFLQKNFGLGKHCFHATNHLKTEAKEFFLVNVNVII